MDATQDRRARERASRAGAPDAARGLGCGRDPVSDDGPDHAAVLDALDALPRHELEALRLTEWDGLNLAEAAVVAGCCFAAFRVRVHRARRRLRAADPAADLPATDPAQLVRAIAAAQQMSTDATANTAIPPTRQRRAVVAAVAASAIVLTLAAAVAVVTRSDHHSLQATNRSVTPSTTHPRQDRTAPPPTTHPPSGRYPDHALALRQVRAALATLPIVPGARKRAAAPTHVLENGDESEGIGQLIDRTRFWTAPGTVSSALRYLQRHAPPHTYSSGPDASGEIPFHAGRGRPGRIFIAYLVVRHAGGIAIRADVQNLWFPTKTAAEVIGVVTSVDIVVRHGMYRERHHVYGPNGVKYAPTVRRSLVGAPAQRLAAAVDAAPVGGYDGSCPISLYKGSDRLAFHTVSRTITVIDDTGSCGGLSLKVFGGRPVGLLGNVDVLVLKSLGLPADYGR